MSDRFFSLTEKLPKNYPSIFPLVFFASLPPSSSSSSPCSISSSSSLKRPERVAGCLPSPVSFIYLFISPDCSRALCPLVCSLPASSKEHEATPSPPPYPLPAPRRELSGAEVAFLSSCARGLNGADRRQRERPEQKRKNTQALVDRQLFHRINSRLALSPQSEDNHHAGLPVGDRLCLRVWVVVFVSACVCAACRCLTTMPRSFLVKKVKLDDFSTGADLENAYRHRTDLSLRLHDKGRSCSLHSAH